MARQQALMGIFVDLDDLLAAIKASGWESPGFDRLLARSPRGDQGGLAARDPVRFVTIPFWRSFRTGFRFFLGRLHGPAMEIHSQR